MFSLFKKVETPIISRKFSKIAPSFNSIRAKKLLENLFSIDPVIYPEPYNIVKERP